MRIHQTLLISLQIRTVVGPQHRRFGLIDLGLRVQERQRLIVDILNQSQRMQHDLLSHRGGDPGQHQKRWLDGIVRPDDVDGPAAVQFGCQGRGQQVAAQVAVVGRHEAVVGLGFDVFECCKESGVAEGVFEEGEAPAGKDAAGADLAELVQRVVPHCRVFAAEDFVGAEADGEGVEGGGYC